MMRVVFVSNPYVNCLWEEHIQKKVDGYKLYSVFSTSFSYFPSIFFYSQYNIRSFLLVVVLEVVVVVVVVAVYVG